ncbi:Uncharacterized protein Rs2_02886 [Raphanus sativus]|nr:Uncharacterized protein Rs2_02886 [Raphanus sativus]
MTWGVKARVAWRLEAELPHAGLSCVAHSLKCVVIVELDWEKTNSLEMCVDPGLDREKPNSPVVELPTLHGLSREVGRAHKRALHDDAARVRLGEADYQSDVFRSCDFGVCGGELGLRGVKGSRDV